MVVCRASLAALAVLSMWACGSDPIVRGRADTGIAPSDGGTNAPLALMAGMTFSYRGILTYREAQLGAEQNSTWTMRLMITSADDKGSQSGSERRVS